MSTRILHIRLLSFFHLPQFLVARQRCTGDLGRSQMVLPGGNGLPIPLIPHICSESRSAKSDAKKEDLGNLTVRIKAILLCYTMKEVLNTGKSHNLLIKKALPIYEIVPA